MKLYIVRHGQTDLNAQKRMQARRGLPLNATGIAQAEELAGELAGVRFSEVWSSPQERAVETARIASGGMEVRVYGTEFNVNADKDAGMFSVALIEGSISLSNHQNPGEQIVMHPNEKVSLEKGHLIFKEYEASKDILWTEGILDISGLDFSELMRKLEMAFGVSITVNRQMSSEPVFDLAKIRISDGIDKALEVTSNGVEFSYRRDPKTGVIFIE